ncbi:retrovirus-related Pol polyprotein from transposon 412 [Trichonephila clavipes]|uniref:Retrovirus-related Pol polyprotein from transposon 412 n=1 Tax=Trichonephila clavipes TaxID=2585209 RepID=A0A8X6S903_TRICX|nr:retrovirus-related Pol polyprotein from transposon 412 [Trichonephila clavipes]
MILNLTTCVIEVIRRTLDAIHNAANQDLHLVAHLLGPVRKPKTCDLRGRLEKSLQMNKVNSGLYAVNDAVIPENSIRKISALAKDHQTLENVIVTGMKNFERSKEVKVPATIVTLQNGEIDIWIANSSSQPQIIPTGICIAKMSDIEDGVVSSLNENADKIKIK